MADLRDRVKQTTDWAALHTERKQREYAHNYNLRARDKRFDEGEKVIVFDDMAGKCIDAGMARYSVAFSCIKSLQTPRGISGKKNDTLEKSLCPLMPDQQAGILKLVKANV